MADDRMHEVSTIVHGLRFYTPDPSDGGIRTAYEWFESLDLPREIDVVHAGADGVYAITPAGEVEMSKLDTSGLDALQSEMQEIRRAKQSKGEISTATAVVDETLPWGL